MRLARIMARPVLAAVLAFSVGATCNLAPNLAQPANAPVGTDNATYFTYPIEPGGNDISMTVSPPLLIDPSSLAPGGAPTSAPASPTTQSASVPTQFTLPNPTISISQSQLDFLNRAIAAAQAAQRTSGVPTSVTVAQAILESNWGQSTLSLNNNNYFGIKATSGPGPAGIVMLPTAEFLNGAWVTVQAPFKAYYTMDQSFVDHAALLSRSGIYANAMQHTTNPKLFAQLINQDGYATDPSYATKLIGLMDKFGLYRYDLTSGGSGVGG